MGYYDFYKIQNVFDAKTKMKLYKKFYTSQKIKGLHYVDFISETNSLLISKPNHEIHSLSTCFLIEQKNSNSINSVIRKAHDLKKFLDFIMIWDIELDEADLLILLTGFVHYLQLIKPYRARWASYEWTLFERIPLHENKIKEVSL